LGKFLAFLATPVIFAFPEPDPGSADCYRNDRGIDVHCIKLPVLIDLLTASSPLPEPSWATCLMRVETAGAGFLRSWRLEMRNRSLWLALCLATSFALPTQMQAQEHRGTFEQQLACTPDVFRLCNAEIPDENRIVACLRQNTALLGDSCRAVFEAENSVPEPSATPKKPTRSSRLVR
jgi:hypothetical protein